MAQNSLNVYLSQSELDKLHEVLGGVVENIQTSAVSEAIKNKNGSGDPEGGSVIYKRFKNAQLKDKGTARAAGKGDALRDANVIVNIDTDKEVIEELQNKDVKLLGVPALAEKRAANAAKRITAFLDRQFFAVAKAAATAYAGSETTPKAIVDDMIVAAKSVQSDYIDGIDAEDLCIVLDAQFRKAVKNDLDALPNGTAASNGLIGVYDGIEVHESNRMPENTHVMVMLKGAVAQPQYVSEYDAEKIPLDDAIALELFSYSGCAALNPEAIFHYTAA